MLLLRVHTTKARLPEVLRRVQELALTVPVPPAEIVDGRLRNARYYVALLTPLGPVLGPEADAKIHEARLYNQVVPILDALATDG